MEGLIPSFDWQRVVVDPWTVGLPQFGWIILMGFLVSATCGLTGCWLILRRMSLVGDAISHSILPGVVIAFLMTGSRGTWPMLLGALAAGAVTTLLIEWLHRGSRIKQDAAIGISFSFLFALGAVLLSIFSGRIDLDAECVLYGEIGFVAFEPRVMLWGMALAPEPVMMMGAIGVLTVLLIGLLFKELLIASFDSGLAGSMGLRPAWMHYGLMAWVSVVVVGAFEAVGAILVVAMLILPGATASLLTDRLSRMLGLSVVHAGLSSLIGLHLGVWLDCSLAAAMVVAGLGIFLAVWLLAPEKGIVARFLLRRSRAYSE